MDQRRKIMVLAGLGAFILLGMFLSVGMRKGQNLVAEAHFNSNNLHRSPAESSQRAATPLVRLLSVNPQSLQTMLKAAGNQATLIYTFSVQTPNFRREIRLLHKMKVFYAPYQIGIEFLNLDREGEDEGIQAVFDGLESIPDYPILRPEGEAFLFLKSLAPVASSTTPAFLFLISNLRLLIIGRERLPSKILIFGLETLLSNRVQSVPISLEPCAKFAVNCL
ncbi:MAG: hypothetical protein IPK68_02545 [Bdellovibrionales bacterium]|nr:hypothetical protein [Bdellovibrionales bacterium]